MSNEEKGALLESISKLPEKDKQFVLGYAAGRSASVSADTVSPETEPHKNQTRTEED